MADKLETYSMEVKLVFDESSKQAAKAIQDFQATFKSFAKDAQVAAKSLKDAGFAELSKDMMVIKKPTDDAAASLEKMARAGQALSQADASKSLKGWSDRMRQFEAEMSTLPQKLELTRAKLKELEAAGQRGGDAWKAYAAEMYRLADASKKLDAASQGSVEGMKGLRFGVQNASYQLTDFAVSVQNGTKASVAFGQQIPQVLGALGAWGAAAGLVATLSAAFFGKFIDDVFKFKSAAKELEDSLKKTEEVLGSVGQTTRRFDMDGFREEFNKSSKVVRQNMVAMLELQKVMLDTQLLMNETTLKSTVDAIGKYDTMSRIFKGMSTESERIASDLGLAGENSGKLAENIRGLRQGLVDPSVALENIGSTLAKGNDRAQGLLKTLLEVTKSSKDSYAAQSEISRVLAQIEKSAGGKLALDKDSAKALKDAAASMKQMGEEWDRLLGRADPEAAFTKAAGRAIELATALKKPQAELDEIVKGLKRVRDEALKKIETDALIKGFMELHGVGEETAKQFLKIGQRADTSAEALKVLENAHNALRAAMKEGNLELAAMNAQLIEQARNAIPDNMLPFGDRFQKQIDAAKAGTKNLAEAQAEYNRFVAENLDLTAQMQVSLAKQNGVQATAAAQMREFMDTMQNSTGGVSDFTDELERMVATGQYSFAELAAAARKFDIKGQVADQIRLIDDLGKSVAGALSGAFGSLVSSIGDADFSFRKFAANFLRQIGQMIAQMVIMNTLKSAFPSFFNSAHGNAFAGATGLPQGIYPPVPGGWLFPMTGARPMNFANGGTIGRLAESSRAEAIVPLVRHGGDLGVKASPVNIVVNNTVSNDTRVEMTETNRPDGTKDISFLVRRELGAAMSDGSMDRSMNMNYGMRRRGA